MKYYLTFIVIFFLSHVNGQNKYDYNWTIGYDTSLLDPGGDVILMNFNFSPVNVQTVKTVERFASEGSGTTMSDSAGNLIFYTSGCYVVNAAHEIMQNGDSINPGIIQHYYCPSGNSPNLGGAIAIPWPDSPNLYLLFVNDYASVLFPGESFTSGSSMHLYYNVIDMTKDAGLGAVTIKNHVAILDTMTTNSIEACRHVNGRDWWVLIPVSRSNCYYLILVTPTGVQSPKLVCNGISWDKNDEVGQAFFTPDATKYIRFNDWNGIHIYDFDSKTGFLSNEKVVNIDDLSFNSVGATVSPNSRYLYVNMITHLFQYDLQASDIADSRVLLTVNDDVPDPFVPSGFILSALAPDGKIYISSGSSHLSLHVIHRPDCPGLYSLPERRGLHLSSLNYYSIPNIPFFKNEPSMTPCDSMVVQAYTPVDGSKAIVVYPNPGAEVIYVLVNHLLPSNADWNLYNSTGQLVRQIELKPGVEKYSTIIEDLSPGVYFYSVISDHSIIQYGKLIVKDY